MKKITITFFEKCWKTIIHFNSLNTKVVFIQDAVTSYILLNVQNVWENEGNFNSTFHWYNSIPIPCIKAKFMMNYNSCSYTSKSTFIISVLLGNSKHATGRTPCYNSFSGLPIQIRNKSVRPPLCGISIKQVTSCVKRTAVHDRNSFTITWVVGIRTANTLQMTAKGFLSQGWTTV